MFHGLNKWPGDLDVGGVWFLDFGKGKSLILVSWIITLSHIRLGMIAVRIQINLVAWFWHRVKKLKRSLHIGYVFQDPDPGKEKLPQKKKKKNLQVSLYLLFFVNFLSKIWFLFPSLDADEPNTHLEREPFGNESNRKITHLSRFLLKFVYGNVKCKGKRLQGENLG